MKERGHRWSHRIRRPVGHQVRGQSRKRLPKAGWLNPRSAGRSQSVACSASRILSLGCRAENRGTPSSTWSLHHRRRRQGRSSLPFRTTRKRRSSLSRSRPGGRSAARHWPANIQKHWVGTNARKGCGQEDGYQSSSPSIGRGGRQASQAKWLRCFRRRGKTQDDRVSDSDSSAAAQRSDRRYGAALFSCRRSPRRVRSSRTLPPGGHGRLRPDRYR